MAKRLRFWIRSAEVEQTLTRHFGWKTPLTSFTRPTQLTKCINFARDRVVADLNCTRTLVVIPAIQAQAVYSYATIYQALLNLSNPPPARAVWTVLNVNFQWSTAYQPALRRLSFSELNAYYRVNPTVLSQPEAFAPYGQQFGIRPSPSGSTYNMEIDSVWLPNQMAQTSDVETAIPDPLGETLVPIMAARFAQWFRRAYEEADQFLVQYEMQKSQLVAAQVQWNVESYYST